MMELSKPFVWNRLLDVIEADDRRRRAPELAAIASRTRALLRMWRRLDRYQRHREIAELGYLDIGGEA